MPICEDAPCCGCCGPAVWAAEDRANEEFYAYDRFLGELDEVAEWDREADCELYPEDHGESTWGRDPLVTEFFGVPVQVWQMECDGCYEVVYVHVNLYPPAWMPRGYRWNVTPMIHTHTL